MLVNVYDILKNVGIFSSNQYRVVSEVIVDGEVRKTYNAPVAITCGVLPMTGNELKNTPEGQYTIEDKVILCDKDCPLKAGDVLITNEFAYEVKNLIDVGELAGLKKYIAKRIATGDALVADIGPVTYNAGWDEFLETFENGLL